MERTIHTEFPPLLIDVLDMGYKIFDDAPFDLNIIGERTLPATDNAFDDFINVVYMDELGRWIHERFKATTDPGRYWLTKPNYKPCAIMVHPQQARGAWKLGKHRGKYEALVQWRPVKLWRDGNKDQHADYNGPITHELVGINIHKSSSKINGSVQVDRWSAGCQVFQNPADFERFMELVKLQIERCGYRTFTYTLITRQKEE